MTTGQTIKKYMDQLGWSVIDLHRLTLISISDLEAAIKGDYQLTLNQLMNIVNKINLKQPKSNHWATYHEIVVAPIMEGVNHDNQQK
jgi:predicted RecB family endonuclease